MKNKIQQLLTKSGKLTKLRIYNKELYSKIGIEDIYEQIKNLNFKDASKILYDLYYPEKANRNCPICDNQLKFKSFGYGYSNTCGSIKCINKFKIQKAKQTCLERYGCENPMQVDNIKEKVKNTNLERYGVENVYQSAEIKEKIKQTNLKKYKVEYPIQSKEIKDKIKKTFKRKYGFEYISQSPEIKEKVKQTNLKRYGVEYLPQSEEFKIKSKKTCLKKYGTEYPVQSKEIKDKIKKTFKKKYYTDHPLKCKKIQEKIKRTNLKKYGTKYHISSNIVKEKIKQTNLKKYGVENVFQVQKIKEKIKQTWKKNYSTEYPMQKHINNYKEFINISSKKDLDKFIEDGYFNMDNFCFYFNITYKVAYDIKNKLNYTVPNKSNKYKMQKEIFEFIREFNNNVTFNDRNIISPLEIDILSNKYKFGIEFNGLMFHSFGISKHSMFNNVDNESTLKKQHLKKTELLESKGYQLFHIFENEWIDPIKRDIWKSKILYKMNKIQNKIPARKCTIKEVPSKEAKVFLENNHLQGYVGAKIKIGLYYNDELIQICTFGKPRMTKKFEYELLRLCTKKYTVIQGGASKLVKYFKRKYNPKSIVSYANRRWSQGNIYEKNNFKLINISNFNYYYFKQKDYVLYSRNKFQKHKLKTLLEDFNPDLTETENMYNNGYRKIFDCGNLVYSYSII